MQDSEIIGLFFARDEAALEHTREKYGAYLAKIAYNILGDSSDSEECVSDTYLSAWDSIPPDEPRSLSAYLAKIVRCRAIDLFRKSHREKRFPSEYADSIDELAEIAPASSDTESEFDRKLLSEAINSFIRTLPDDARRLFIMRYYFLDPLKKAAASCAMTESRAKSLLYRTRLDMKEYLKKEGFDV